MIDLAGVTLCCIDTVNHRLALRALARSQAGIGFGRTLFLTASLPHDVSVPEGIDVVPIEPIVSRDQYSQFVLKSLLPHVATPQVLLVQWDGYVVHPESWDPAFVDWDYIGAQWFWHTDGMRVGNGGFSLRSRRLLEALQDSRVVLADGEDDTICRTFRPLLEREHGIRFAPEAVADRFSFEAAYPTGKPFGFHGLFNFCRVVPQDELAALADLFSPQIACSPQLDQLLRNCIALGQWSAAIAIARRILAAQPANADARTLLAQAEAGAARGPAVGRNDPCPCGSGRRYKHCHGAVGASAAGAAAAPAAPAPPATADALVARAMQVHQRGDLAAAERGYRDALAARPRHPHALHFLGVVLYQRGRLAEALPLLEQAVTLIPNEPEFHNNLGLALLASDRVAEAIAAHREALRLAPDNFSASNNLGLALQEANDLPGAIVAFRDALARKPDFARAHWNLGLALLAHRDFAQGWREYDWRLGIDELTRGRQLPTSTRWDGSDPAGRTILLTAEQGLGDALQFVRFARPLALRGARVLVETNPALARLLATAPGVAATCPTGAPTPAHDLHLPLLSLAGALGVTADTIPGDVPYVAPDAQDVVAIGAELQRHRPNLLVGLSWAGNPRYSADRRRSCPLAALAPLLELPGVTFFSLQRDDGEDQLPGVPAARNIVLLDARRDFDRKAALVGALDLVISVDTSHAHLAGALARPVWVLLPFSPDWRWQLDRSDSPWYPTARLFRQRRHGQWDAPIDAVRQALAAMVANRR